MGKIPENLRQIIASNIRTCRKEKFPGPGGAKKCAKAFGVMPQQWCPWERGKRTPDESRLAQIAAFFGKSVEYMRHDNQPSPPGWENAPDESRGLRQNLNDSPTERPPYTLLSVPELLIAMQRDNVKAVYQVEVSVTSVRFVRNGEEPRPLSPPP